MLAQPQMKVHGTKSVHLQTVFVQVGQIFLSLSQCEWTCGTIGTPHGVGVSVALFVAVMVGNAPNTTVVPLAFTLHTNLPLSHSVFQCTS